MVNSGRTAPTRATHRTLTAGARELLARGLFLLCAAAPIAAQCEFAENQKFIPADSAPGDIYGGAVGICGDVMFIMSEWDDINDDDVPDECQSFWAEIQTISLLAGGTQSFNRDAGPANANSFYRVLGTYTGTSPGIWFSVGIILPLNFDEYFRVTLQTPGLSPYFTGYKGSLSPTGTAVVSFTILPGTDPTLAGVVLHHA